MLFFAVVLLHMDFGVLICGKSNVLSFDAFVAFFPLAESLPRDLQITAYKIMVCSCVEPSKRVLLQILIYSCVLGTTFSRGKKHIAFLS